MNKLIGRQQDQKLVLNERGCIHFVDLANIYYLLCEAYLTTIFSKNKTEITVSKLLKEFENDLDSFGFFRINRNCIVNLRYISQVKTGKEPKVQLNSDLSFHLSKKRLIELRKRLKSFEGVI
ncbi:MAG: LytR/AlgR family response regulator transcription factor [Bacteroidales bacterium]